MKAARQDLNLKIREVASESGIDQALISKYESGSRLPSEDHLLSLARIYKKDGYNLRSEWLAEKVLDLIGDDRQAVQVLSLAESRLEYLSGKKALVVPHFSSTLQKKLEELDLLKAEWQKRKPQNAAPLQKQNAHFKIEFTFESNRMSGNTLTLQETAQVVIEGLTIGGKPMKDHLAAINFAEAVDFIHDLLAAKDPFNKRTLLELHALIFRSIDRENAGRFRNETLRIAETEYRPPEPAQLEKLLDDYFLHFKKQERLLHPVLLAAEMQARLLGIHPFLDGNDRTARLMMNLILLKNGYTIAILKGDLKSRQDYFGALEKARVEKGSEAFYHLVADSLKATLEAHLALI